MSSVEWSIGHFALSDEIRTERCRVCWLKGLGVLSVEDVALCVGLDAKSKRRRLSLNTI